MELICLDMVFLDEELTNKEAVLNRVADIMLANGRIESREQYLTSLREREEIAPTDIGFSVAIPHGKDDTVLHPSLTFVRLRRPIQWNEDTAQVIFGIAVPQSGEANIHLKLLQRIARKIVREQYQSIFEASQSREEILTAILEP